ncbi:hypothetical protein GGD54_006158 [Rhizobium tropici]|uniref:Uncharacterized protein n=1 Tax=Rhizobium tropici TaxID=398 RepID=A0ABR6R987_RHITR|nr:hypothetical protein [Rhizobium tropici]MBB5596717.1 hypothetical protein [Rhizobium tropici]MBB6495711.1 hypothetical protein [Rhizobium tropici]
MNTSAFILPDADGDCGSEITHKKGPALAGPNLVHPARLKPHSG